MHRALDAVELHLQMSAGSNTACTAISHGQLAHPGAAAIDQDEMEGEPHRVAKAQPLDTLQQVALSLVPTDFVETPQSPMRPSPRYHTIAELPLQAFDVGESFPPEVEPNRPSCLTPLQQASQANARNQRQCSPPSESRKAQSSWACLGNSSHQSHVRPLLQGVMHEHPSKPSGSVGAQQQPCRGLSLLHTESPSFAGSSPLVSVAGAAMLGTRNTNPPIVAHPTVPCVDVTTVTGWASSPPAAWAPFSPTSGTSGWASPSVPSHLEGPLPQAATSRLGGSWRWHGQLQ